MKLNNMINTDSGINGIFRAKLLSVDGDSEMRAFIPGINNINPFTDDGTVDIEIYNSHKHSFPKVQWCCYNIESKEPSYLDSVCWVMFENGDFKRPVVVSYSVVGGNGLSNNLEQAGTTNGNPVNQTIDVTWWQNQSVTYYVAGGGSGTVNVKSEATTSGLMYMNRTDWNKSSRQYLMQNRYSLEYSANGLITIEKLPVVATIDFWNLGNAYVGRVIRVEFENGVKCDMIIGDVKGNIAAHGAVDYTVLNLGHLMGSNRDVINIIEYGCNKRLPSANEINSVTGSEGTNTKSITLLDIDYLS